MEDGKVRDRNDDKELASSNDDEGGTLIGCTCTVWCFPAASTSSAMGARRQRPLSHGSGARETALEWTGVGGGVASRV